MMKTHSFLTSLEASQWAEYEPAMGLERFFGPYHLTAFADGPTAFQKAGIDAAIFYNVDKMSTLDIKLDSYVSDRLAIEVVSNTKTGKLGWAVDADKRTDYYVYHFTKTGETFVLPALLLRQWIEVNHEVLKEYCIEGKEGFKRIVASNRTYDTICYGIPKKVILDAFGKTCRTNYPTITLGDKK